MIIYGKIIHDPYAKDWQRATKLAGMIQEMNVPFDLRVTQILSTNGVNPSDSGPKTKTTIIFKKSQTANNDLIRHARFRIKELAIKVLGDKCRILGFPHRFEIQIFC